MHQAESKPRILLVDDDEDFLFQHRIQLENAGFAVATAGSRSEAEEKTNDFRPDLAILDLMMEHHDDGFVLSHHLKRKFPGLPVILVTAVTSETGLVFDPASPEQRAWIGADALLAKPIRFEQLQREIDRLVNRQPSTVDR
jgi:DNA-binding response OmpR family regulator